MRSARLPSHPFLGERCCGILLGRLFPSHHLSQKSTDAVKSGMGLMTALILGLLVASAKGSYDAQNAELIQRSGKIVFLNRELRAGNQSCARFVADERSSPSQWFVVKRSFRVSAVGSLLHQLRSSNRHDSATIAEGLCATVD